jgi:hypothetical protein
MFNSNQKNYNNFMQLFPTATFEGKKNLSIKSIPQVRAQSNIHKNVC